MSFLRSIIIEIFLFFQTKPFNFCLKRNQNNENNGRWENFSFSLVVNFRGINFRLRVFQISAEHTFTFHLTYLIQITSACPLFTYFEAEASRIEIQEKSSSLSVNKFTWCQLTMRLKQPACAWLSLFASVNQRRQVQGERR